MPVSGLTLRLVKGSPLSASEGDQNFVVLRNAVNALQALFGVVLNPNGTLKAGAVNDVGQISDGLITAVKLAADANLPVGTILDNANTVTPTGYLLCDGTSYLRADYVDLYAALRGGGASSPWGEADGTHFNVPNLSRRVTVGMGGAGTATLANTVAATGGEENHMLTTGEMPSHTHTVTDYAGVGTDNLHVDAGVTEEPDVGAVTGATGGGGSHNTIQPSAVVRKIIKY